MVGFSGLYASRSGFRRLSNFLNNLGVKYRLHTFSIPDAVPLLRA